VTTNPWSKIAGLLLAWSTPRPGSAVHPGTIHQLAQPPALVFLQNSDRHPAMTAQPMACGQPPAAAILATVEAPKPVADTQTGQTGPNPWFKPKLAKIKCAG